MKTSKGVYFIADDRMMELCLAFLNSFRYHNPNLNLCLIPYNNNYKALEKIKDTYNFNIYSNKKILDECDIISSQFHDTPYGHYRKLAIWEGSFSEFIYIDIDTVVLSDFDFIFDLLADFDFVTSTSNIPETEKWVWKKSVYNTQLLQKEQIQYAANTGFIASKKSALNIEKTKAQLHEALKLKTHMNLYCFEQPLLNFLIVNSQKKYTSINKLSRIKGNYHLKTERWAGDKNGVIKNNQITFKNSDHPVLFLHWAGEWQLYPFERNVFRFLKFIGLLKQKDLPLISINMPYKKLWKHYRFLT